MGDTNGWTGDDGNLLGGDKVEDIGGCWARVGEPLGGSKVGDTSGCRAGGGAPLGDGTVGAITEGPWLNLNTEGRGFLTCHDRLLKDEDCNIGDEIPLGEGRVVGING